MKVKAAPAWHVLTAGFRMTVTKPGLCEASTAVGHNRLFNVTEGLEWEKIDGDRPQMGWSH